ncbi:MAG: SDR family NAD(P)-dependent oxidoreductase [Pseudomonadales bacterium]|nr:SDR family NAD(P)-dependent oxidoreductase [Pseudomonadales bacterium]
MSISFEGKVAIVTGAGAGIGRTHALELARRGAKVLVNDLGGSGDGVGSSSEVALAVVEEIKALGGEAIANGASVADEKGAQSIVDDAMNAWGRVDIVINNAGILRDKSFQKGSLEDFKLVTDVNLYGSMLVTKAAWPIMKEQNYGRVVFTTSESGLLGNFGQTHYGGAKMGLIGIMNSLHIEGRKYNITVNSLAPAAVTRLTKHLMPKKAEDTLKPEFVTRGALFLCSEDAPNGLVLAASGGKYFSYKLFRNEGITLEADATLEDFAAQADQVFDMAGARPTKSLGAS